MLEKVKPGMTIFLGTGMAEPRTFVKELMASDRGNLQDLELIQLVSLGDTVSIDERYRENTASRRSTPAGWQATPLRRAGSI